MALDAALPAGSRSVALARGLTARVQLTLVVVASAVVRTVASAAHPVPRLFPDEYLYTSIARSLGSGHGPAVRGASAHFPALLAPLAAAPLQALFSPVAAYRLTQAENALFMSLAAVPVYLLARRLGVRPAHALLCAAFAVAIPDLVYASYTLSDPVAYPLVLGAVAAGVCALARPRLRTQVLFLALAGLATFARVQYVVLPIAYLAAAVAIDRRRVLRTQRLPLALCVAPVLGALALGPSHVLGYYSHVTGLHVGGGIVHWALSDLFLLAYASGMLLVPGALVGLARPRGRSELAFSALAAAFAVTLLAEAALYSANGSPRFHERYLFTLLPLVPVAFALYARRGFPHGRVVAVVSFALLVLTARIPLSQYAIGLGKFDSPFLFAVARLERELGTGQASLLVALLAAVVLLGAIAVAHRRAATVALAAAVGLAALASVGAFVDDARQAQGVQRELVASPPSWVDDAHVGPVTLVQTPSTLPAGATEQLYWNRSIRHEALLDGAQPTDVYAASKLLIRRDGTLAGVTPAVLVNGFGATLRFQNAARVAHAGSWSLWSASSAPRLSYLERGRFGDGWLARRGSLTVWPDATGRVRGTLSFMLSLPRAATHAVTIRFGRNRYTIRPGRVSLVTYSVDALGVFRLPFSADRVRWLDDLRGVSVRQTAPVLHRAPGPAAPASVSA